MELLKWKWILVVPLLAVILTVFAVIAANRQSTQDQKWQQKCRERVEASALSHYPSREAGRFMLEYGAASFRDTSALSDVRDLNFKSTMACIWMGFPIAVFLIIGVTIGVVHGFFGSADKLLITLISIFAGSLGTAFMGVMWAVSNPP